MPPMSKQNFQSDDIRWKQRFDNYLLALSNLEEAVVLATTRPLSRLEEQGMIQSFEFTHQLAWNVLKDYLEYQGETEILGSKDTVRMAFRQGLVPSGEDWMDMIKARNLSSHTYNIETAKDIVANITKRFYPAFLQMKTTFTHRYHRDDTP
jgi:nucleotidyltransferase substrate binding protein (TIGR01987 family)